VGWHEEGRKREEGRNEKWDQSRHGDLNDEFSHVYARMVPVFPLAPHWRNLSTLADELSVGDTSLRQGDLIIDLAHRSRHVMNHPLPNPESIKPKLFSLLFLVVHKKGYIW
jgi:hypothetical protein